MMLDAVGQSYHGLSFRFDRDKDWYFTENSLAANPVCTHAGNENGVNVRLEVSLREKPILPIRATPQITQNYFKLLPFEPAGIPSLAYEEAVAEKIRAASQRSKIRDLHDLSDVAGRPHNRELIRALAVIKLWESDRNNLDYGQFTEQIKSGGDYDLRELTNLLRKDQRPDLEDMIGASSRASVFSGR